MWKDIRKICVKLLALILPFFVLLPLYCSLFPQYYLDEEYAMYAEQHDYVTGKLNITRFDTDNQQDQVLILGDSRTKAGMDPMQLWNGSYNLALGGTTAIEGYYTLKNYLKHHEKPQKVVMAYAPMHYMDVDTLWTRCIYFHTLSNADFKDLVKTAKNFEDTQNILIKDYEVEYQMYRFWMPNKYATALKKAKFFFRHHITTQKYTAMVEFDGHTYYGTADYSDGVNGEAKVEDFKPSDIITYYLEKTIELCEQNGIQVVIEQTPVNETSYGIFTQPFKDHFRSYMNQLAAKYPQIPIYTDFYVYPNDCFGDADHLNEKGVKVYCKALLEKYPDH